MNGQQKTVFSEVEANSWFERNAAVLDPAKAAKSDPLIRQLEKLGLKSKRVLEVGCANGWRLEYLRMTWGAECFGIEPSAAAVESGLKTFPELKLVQGTADELPFEAGSFDLVLAGFCLYLCDPCDLFRIASEVDRVLADQGRIGILDFHSEFPYRNEYKHREGIFAHKMDYSQLFEWHPFYKKIAQDIGGHSGSTDLSPDNLVAATILSKTSTDSYVLNPYSK